MTSVATSPAQVKAMPIHHGRSVEDARSAAARRIAAEEQERAGEAKRQAELEVFEAIQTVRGLIVRWGKGRVATWVVTQAAELDLEVK